MIKVKDGYAKLIDGSLTGSADCVLVSNGSYKKIGTGANELVQRNDSGQIVSTVLDISPFVVNSNELTQNLNADLLDGMHADDLCTAVTSDPTTNFKIEIGGGSRQITNLYATHSTYLKSLGALTPLTGRNCFDGNVYSYNITDENQGDRQYSSVIGFGLGYAGTIELAGRWASHGLWYRGLRDRDQDTWSNWITIYDSSNSKVEGTSNSITVKLGNEQHTLTIPSSTQSAGSSTQPVYLNNGQAIECDFKIWKGTAAQYAALAKDSNTLYFIY